MPDRNVLLKLVASTRDFEAAMRQLGETLARAGTSFAGFDRAWRKHRPLAAVAIKPALRGRRHGW